MPTLEKIIERFEHLKGVRAVWGEVHTFLQEFPADMFPESVISQVIENVQEAFKTVDLELDKLKAINIQEGDDHGKENQEDAHQFGKKVGRPRGSGKVVGGSGQSG